LVKTQISKSKRKLDLTLIDSRGYGD